MSERETLTGTVGIEHWGAKERGFVDEKPAGHPLPWTIDHMAILDASGELVVSLATEAILAPGNKANYLATLEYIVRVVNATQEDAHA